MNEYSYKVMLTADAPCLAKRAVVFHDDRFLNFDQIAKIAPRKVTSQTCPRCHTNHADHDYVPTEIERGEPDGRGGFNYRDVRFSYGEYDPQLELGL